MFDSVSILNTFAPGGAMYPGLKVINTYSNHSYGTVAEFRTQNAAGSDRPSILFSSNVRDKLTTEEVNHRTQKLILFLILFTTPILVGLSLYSSEIVSLIFNETWKDAAGIIKILSIAMIFRVISSQWHLGLLSQKKHLLLSKISVLFLFLFIVLFYFGIYNFGLQGAVYSVLVFYILTSSLIFRIFFINNIYLKDSLILVVLSLISVIIPKIVIDSGVELNNLIFGVLSSIISYIFLVYILNKTTYLLIKNQFNFASKN